MIRIIVLSLKDLQLLWRDRLGLFWVVAFPLLMALFFGAVFAGKGEEAVGAMRIGVVDEDSSKISSHYVAQLEKSTALEISRLTLKEAKERVLKGELVAYLVLNKGFGKKPWTFFAAPPRVELGIDPSRPAEAGYLQGLLIQAAVEMMWGGGAESRDKDFRWQPLKIDIVSVTPEEGKPRTSFEISFPSAMLWGVLACAAGFAISIVTERVKGTFLRLRLAPISLCQILAAKGMACFISCIAVISFLVLFGRITLGVRIESLLAMVLATLSVALCFVGIMMFISVLGKTESSVAGAGWAIVCVMAMLGGGMVPLIAMPEWMLMASNFSPVKWGILSLEGAIWRGFSLVEMALPCGILIGTGLLFFIVGLSIFSRTET